MALVCYASLMKQKPVIAINRRAFFRGSTLVLGAGILGGGRALEALAGENAAPPAVKIGMVTDVHYADRDTRINRFYRESRAKLRESIDQFNRLKPDFIVELGDFIDAAENLEDEIEHLRAIEAEFSRFSGRRVYVIGNHCVTTLTKEEFLDHSGARETFYSFDHGPFHFIVLDACYRADGVSYGRDNFRWTDTEIPPAQQDWLRWDLRNSNKPSVVFVHQRLDVENNYGVKSASIVRGIFEESGKVLAVFQGHSHRNEHREIGGIHYCTLRAMVEGSGEENSGYGLLNLFGDGSMHMAGFRQQAELRFPARS
jgi:predicted phosphodiesterase